MENNDNILLRIREILGISTANFSILEHQVDVKVQMEYFEFSKVNPPVDDQDLILSQESKLYSVEIENEEKRALMVSLASIAKPEAYRILQRFIPLADESLREWAIMASQENRMLLETQLLDEQQVFISTGLGGKNGKLRYFVVIFSLSDQPFSLTQQKLIQSDFEFVIKKYQSELEHIKFIKTYCTMVALVPLSTHVRLPFQMAIDECNSLGSFIKQGFLITNIKLLDEDEIDEILKNPPESINE